MVLHDSVILGQSATAKHGKAGHLDHKQLILSKRIFSQNLFMCNKSQKRLNETKLPKYYLNTSRF